ncbi:hypothetical protein SAMN05216376_111146 [Mameliella alba]|uniref:hypothetical protein n=1 Tax=Mameliella alba TaxID=561184 RepID=UPI00088BD99E|nr:hypothetical protein [Mameliella alba]OWV46469.1 hypothetical protein CDZ96_17810 [Mameliella alba]PTR37278.1 hypothetical protein LX94_03617 [Mameliella alba]GGF73500.1 hypothetical protein GCM10011319_37490 [Mameliella alba]SDD77125.1 hypothetical protein SAMN05216376_111146 [Mameliella alba]
MADMNAPMSTADHVLCNAALALVLQLVEDHGERAMLLDVLATEASKASALNSKVEEVALAAEDLRTIGLHGRGPGSPEWASARHRLQRALQQWAMWRLGVALDRVRAGKAVA